MLEGVAGDDLPDQVLYVPAGIHKICSKPIEQFRMNRELALHAEVFWCLHDSDAKELLPESVDGDPCG